MEKLPQYYGSLLHECLSSLNIWCNLYILFVLMFFNICVLIVLLFFTSTNLYCTYLDNCISRIEFFTTEVLQIYYVLSFDNDSDDDVYFVVAVDDICMPFCNATKEVYHGINDRSNFFRPGIRSLLVS